MDGKTVKTICDREKINFQSIISPYSVSAAWSEIIQLSQDASLLLETSTVHSKQGY